jgi:hypothetical protein
MNGLIKDFSELVGFAIILLLCLPLACPKERKKVGRNSKSNIVKVEKVSHILAFTTKKIKIASRSQHLQLNSIQPTQDQG